MRTLNDRTTRINQRLQRLAWDRNRVNGALVSSDDKNRKILRLRSDRLGRSIGTLQNMLDKEHSE